MDTVRVAKLTYRLRVGENLRAVSADLKTSVQDHLLRPVLAKVGARVTAKLGRKAKVDVRELHFKLRIKRSEIGTSGPTLGIIADLADYVLSQGRRPMRSDPAAVFDAPVQIFASPSQKTAVGLIAAVERRKQPDGTRPDLVSFWRQLARKPDRDIALCLEDCAGFGRLDAVLNQLSVPELHALFTKLDGTAATAVLTAVRMARAQKSQPADMRQTAQDKTRQGSGPAEDQTAENRAKNSLDSPTSKDKSDPVAPKIPRTATTATPKVQDRPADLTQAKMQSPPTARAASPDQPDHTPADTGVTNIVAADPDSAPVDTAMPLVVTSKWCGLLYLVNIALHAGMPELLWRVGISEGDALGEMLRLISGGADDPAADCLSPSFPRTPPPDVPPAQWVRRELDAELTTILSDMDPALVPRAVALDASLRDGHDWSLPARGASVLLALCEHALGRPLSTPDRAKLFGLQGRIVVEDDKIVVFQTVDAINLEIRKAGLDADPRDLLWLNKDLRFVFTDTGEGP